jgi:hypothetical protein
MSFIALQDNCTKETSPRSVALEKCSGAIKMFSEKYTNICLKLVDYKSDFDIQIINNFGVVVEDRFVSYGEKYRKRPALSQVNNTCEFSFRLKRSSQTDKCFYYIVVIWKTSSESLKFLVSCAFISFTKNSIHNQSIDLCSYLSMNVFDLSLVVNSSNNKSTDLRDSLLIISAMVRANPQQSFVVYQDHKLTLKNQLGAVTTAAMDIEHMMNNSDGGNGFRVLTKSHNVNENYSCAFSLIQQYEEDLNAKTAATFSIITTISDLEQVPPKDEIRLKFSLTIARSVGQLNKGSEV